MFLDMDRVAQLQADKLIRSADHPTYPLRVLNYTENTQLGRLWERDAYLPMCRGLVITHTGQVIGRCLKKFGNIGEFVNITTLSTLPSPEITDKLDGSYVQMSYYNGEWVFSTRGTFESEQALLAHTLWHNDYASKLLEPLNPDYTYAWEYTSPTNRVVLRYSEDKLTCVAIIDTESGKELSYAEIHKEAARVGVDAVAFAQFDGPWQNLTTLERSGVEGYVLFFPDQQLRVKIKLEEYLTLHRIRSNMTEKFVYDALASNADLSEMYHILEAEDRDWFTKTVQGYQHKFQTMVAEAQAIAQEVIDHNLLDMQNREQRKAAVIFIQLRNPSLVGLVLDILDKKDYTKRVWKMIQ